MPFAGGRQTAAQSSRLLKQHAGRSEAATFKLPLHGVITNMQPKAKAAMEELSMSGVTTASLAYYIGLPSWQRPTIMAKGMTTTMLHSNYKTTTALLCTAG